jgi:hypothetical protein
VAATFASRCSTRRADPAQSCQAPSYIRVGWSGCGLACRARGRLLSGDAAGGEQCDQRDEGDRQMSCSACLAAGRARTREGRCAMRAGRWLARLRGWMGWIRCLSNSNEARCRLQLLLLPPATGSPRGARRDEPSRAVRPGCGYSSLRWGVRRRGWAHRFRVRVRLSGARWLPTGRSGR